MAFRTLDDLGDIKGKRVFVRVDLNVPMADGRVTDETRLRALLPTVSELADKGAKLLLLAHFGRPKGAKHSEMSVSMVLDALQEVLGREVMFVPEIAGDIVAQSIGILADGDIALLENTRFWPGEEQNDPELARAVAANGDLYVNDAFSAAHRAHASTEGVARLLPAYAGRLMEAELKALDAALGNPARPVVAIVGGAKVSTKLELLGNLCSKVDVLVIGGAMANTFLAAQGHGMGKSLQEAEMHATARQIMEQAKAAKCEILLPVDLVVAEEFRANPPTRTVGVDDVPENMMALDVGPETEAMLEARLRTASTLVWNGPLGAFETAPFDSATVAAAATTPAMAAATIRAMAVATAGRLSSPIETITIAVVRSASMVKS